MVDGGRRSTVTEPPRLLLVDDEDLILELLADYFASKGYRVDTASELEEAEAMVSVYPYAAVVTDLRLTGVDSSEGLELVRFIRLHSPDARIVLLTGHASASTESESRRRGVDAFLQKPQPLAALARAVTGEPARAMVAA
jgi:two-component system response regulator RegA